jgi:hypothetical protein
MADLAAEMANVDVVAEIEALTTVVNGLTTDLNAQSADPAHVPPLGIQGGVNLDGATGPPTTLEGGGKRKRKKTRRKKGGFKFTRMANSKRSLRMSRRKSLSKPRKKRKKRNTHKKRKKHRKKTKKHR